MTQPADAAMVPLPNDAPMTNESARVEDALRKSEEWFRLATLGSQLGLWYWDEVRQALLWDVTARELFGAPAEGEVTLQTFVDALHVDDRDRVMRTWRRALENRLPYATDMRAVVSRDGSSKVRWVHARGSGYYDERGEPLVMVGVVFDITDRKEAEQKLRESEERFRLVANAAPVMIWMSGTDKLCDYFNQPWLEFTGQPLEAQLGERWTAGVHPEELKFCVETYSRAFDGREPFEMQYRLRRNDGEYRWILDTGVPRFNSDGSFAGYIGSCIDVTERKLAADALAGLSGRLIEAQEDERNRIARELHDDYAQRLAILSMGLESLAENVAGSSVEIRDQLLRFVDHASELGADLHSLSHRLHSSTLDRLGVVAGLQGFCKEFAQQQSVQVDFSHENVPSGIPADVGLCIFRIAQEALRNIKKHSGVKKAEVRLDCTGETLHLSVSDRGRGFDLHEPSTGIGIRSMEERLRLVGGWLEIHSGASKGARVEAWVPLNRASQLAQTRESSDASELWTGGIP